MEKYDVGLVTVTTHNFGNYLTNYALFQYLKGCGYKVLLIDAPGYQTIPYFGWLSKDYSLFLEDWYKEETVAPRYMEKWELLELNEKCDIFIVGSDQLWRDNFIKQTDYYTALDWCFSDKTKISYATSFGISAYEGCAEKMSSLLNRFHKISIREESALKILAGMGVSDSELVLDPVFLGDMKFYDAMADVGKKRIPKKPYVGAYILEPDEWKQEVVEYVSANYANDAHIVIQAAEEYRTEEYRIELLADAKVEEWLAMIRLSEVFITDSFHGICFALIFEKPFIVVYDKKCVRGYDRIEYMLRKVGLFDRLVENRDSQKIHSLMEQPIDYTNVKKVLNETVEKNKAWLRNAIEIKPVIEKVPDSYDAMITRMLMSQKSEEEGKTSEQKKKNNAWLEQVKGENSNLKIVAWGAGGCFMQHIQTIRKFCDVEIVCDKDKRKWGKELYPGVRCISPSDFMKLENVVVLITMNYVEVANELAGELRKSGFEKVICFSDWKEIVGL